MSNATRDLLTDEEEIVDLGEHRLKDLTRSERIYQLGLGSFPPLRSLNRSNLPETAHPLVGRIVEQLEVQDLLRRTRLVTITGTGGTGKTRLALQIAAELLDEFPDGVHFVPLAALTDAGLVLPVALQALGLSEADNADQRSLLVLDNFEHLREAAPAIARLPRELAGPDAPRDEPDPAARLDGGRVSPRSSAAGGGGRALPRPRAHGAQKRGAVTGGGRDLPPPGLPAARARARSGAAEAARPGRPARTGSIRGCRC